MYRKLFFLIVVLSLVLQASAANKSTDHKCRHSEPGPVPVVIPGGISFWVTKPDQSVLLQKAPVTLWFSDPDPGKVTLQVDQDKTYQEMDGFGAALTGGSAFLIHNLPAATREALLDELFLTHDNSIGISYLRISIGSSDLDASVFSYDDLPPGETDVNLDHFSLAPDKNDLIPVLKSILARNPAIKILGSPWSAPVWMKSNKKSVGGSLQPEYYDAYARYLVRYVTEMKAEGIPIDAITVQNEPLYGGNNPSMVMPADAQRDFIKNNLGPAFRAAGLTTKIIVYDHNCDHPEYVTSILADTVAARYVDGSAFHLYAGDIAALSKVHDAYPVKNVYFTEQWIGGPSKFAEDLKWWVQNLIIGAPRNWSRNVIEWNLASDPEYRPHTPGGCTQCEGTITVDGQSFKRNVGYYILAHAARFVPAGSVRIASTENAVLPNVAFKTPKGKTVLIVLNVSNQTQQFAIGYYEKAASALLESGSVATFVW